MATVSSPRASPARLRSLARSRTSRAATTRSRRTAVASSRVGASSGMTIRSGARKSRSFMVYGARTSQPRFEQLHEVDRPCGDSHPRGAEGLDLLRGRTGRSGDDRARVAHAPARRSRLTGDEADDRLRHVLLHEGSRVLFVGAADLAYHRDRLRLRIGLERCEAVDEVRAVDRIAADADAGALTHAGTRELIDDLVRQRARAA